MKCFFANLILLFVFMSSVSIAQPTFTSGNDPKPAGKKWVKNNSFSDEFNGGALDGNKWLDYHPYWEGRTPARFKKNAVTVSGGNLRIKNYKLSSPEYVGSNKYTIGGGAVSSKADNGHYGYYECRMKASKIGGAKESKNFATHMHANTHYIRNDCSNNQVWKSIGGNAAVGGNVADAYHIYGAYWKDANTILFYIDGVYKFTVNPKKDYSNTPFNRPMQMFLVTETYDWQTPPTDAELADNSKNTTYYDWVRSWTLADDNTPGGTDAISFNNAPTSVTSAKSYTLNVNYSASQSRDIIVEMWSSTSWLASAKVEVGSGSGTKNVTVNLANAPAAGSGYIWKTSIRPTNTDWTKNLKNAQVNNVTVTNASSQIVANGEYEIRNIANGKNLGATSWANWEAVDVAPGAYDDQRWVLRHLGNNTYEIKLKATYAGNKFLEVPYAVCANSTKVATYSAAGSNHQKWVIIQSGSNYMLKPAHCTTQSLDVRPADDRIHTYATNTGSNNQKWNLILAKKSNAISVSTPVDKELSLNMYPNPVQTTLTIELGNSTNEKLIQIIDLTGRVQFETQTTDQKYSLNVKSQLSKGVYLVRVQNGTKSLSTKLVID